MHKIPIQKINKLISALGLIVLLIFPLFLAIYLPFQTKAETVRLIPDCFNSTCLSDPTDVVISDDGSFLLIVDSANEPYVRRLNFSSGGFINKSLIPLNESNLDQIPLKIGISKSGEKAFVFKEGLPEKALVTTSSSSGGDFFERLQVDQGTDCKCPSGTHFNGTVCVNGTLDCSNTLTDPVCSCDTLNFLNSCVARANGVKKFTKGECGSGSNLTCNSDSQCPIGTCPNSSTTFKRFTCSAALMCTLVEFSTDPCSTTSSSDCRCSTGTFFDGTNCVSSGSLNCSNTDVDAVCSCDNLSFLNSCIARANGVKKFTKGDCGSDGTISCNNDSQCPLGNCPNGGSFTRFTCTSGKCKNIVFSSDPCTSTIAADCRCTSGTFFDGTNCLTSGAPDCKGTVEDTVCSCDNLIFLNSCIARANGVKKFTKGGCGDSGISCASDSQCPAGTCPDGRKFKRFTCTGGQCRNIEFTNDPCSSSGLLSSGGSIVQIVDLESNTVTKLNTLLKTAKAADLSTVSFLDPKGEKIIGSTTDAEAPRLLVVNTETGKTENDLSFAGIARSIEFSPSFEKAVITFKDALAQSIGILTARTKQVKIFDTPKSIFFDIDEFLSMVDFDLFGNKAVVSSLSGRHVFHLLDLKDDHLTIRFLGKDLEGQTQSTISPDGNTAIAVANNPIENGIVVYKLNTRKPRLPKLIQTESISDGSIVLDVLITPDNNEVLILVEKDTEKKLKILKLEDLSPLCEFKVSSDLEGTFLLGDQLGRYLLTLNFKDNSISTITNLNPGPVFRSINPAIGLKKGGTLFTIDGFVDPLKFTSDVKVCFRDNNFCASSVSLSTDGKTITGITPKFPKESFTDITIVASPNTSSNLSSSGTCQKEINLESKYGKAFKFK